MIDSREVKKFAKRFDGNVRVKSLKKMYGTRWTSTFIWAYRFNSPKRLREIALKAVYGKSCEINLTATGGNVQTNSMCLSPGTWQIVIDRYNQEQNVL
jgi:hypothetical protein